MSESNSWAEIYIKQYLDAAVGVRLYCINVWYACRPTPATLWIFTSKTHTTGHCSEYRKPWKNMTNWQRHTHTQSKNSAVGFRGCVRVYIYNPVVVLAFSIFFFEILNRTTEMNWLNAVASDAILALFCCCCLYSLIRNDSLCLKKATSYAVF